MSVYVCQATTCKHIKNFFLPRHSQTCSKMSMELRHVPACCLCFGAGFVSEFCFAINYSVCALSSLCWFNARSPSLFPLPSCFLCVTYCWLLVCSFSFRVDVRILVHACQASTYWHIRNSFFPKHSQTYSIVSMELWHVPACWLCFCAKCVCVFCLGVILCMCFVVSTLFQRSFPVSVSTMFLLSLWMFWKQRVFTFQ